MSSVPPHAPVAGGLVVQHGVAVVEGTPLHVLAAQAHPVVPLVQPQGRLQLGTALQRAFTAPI